MRLGLLAVGAAVIALWALRQRQLDPIHEPLTPPPFTEAVTLDPAADRVDALARVPVEPGPSRTRRPLGSPGRPKQFLPRDVVNHAVDLTGLVTREMPTGADAGPVTLHLRAINKAGSPLAGQVVGVSVDLFLDLERGIITSHPLVPSAAQPAKRGGAVRETEPDGRVLITLDRDLFPDRLNVIRIRSEDDRLAAIRKNVVVPANGVIDLGDVRLLRPSDRFPATIASGTVLDHAGQPIELVTAKVNPAYVHDFDVEISSAAAIVDPVVLNPWRRLTDFEVVISRHGSFRVHGPDFDLGRVDRGPTPFALEWEAPGFTSVIWSGLKYGARGLRVRLDAAPGEH